MTAPRDGATALPEAALQAYFEGFHKTLSISPGDVVALVRDDGTFLARSPDLPDEKLLSIGPETFKAAFSATGRSMRGAVSTLDGLERTASYRKLPNQPVWVSYALNTAAVMKDWRANLACAVEPFFATKGVGKGTGLGLAMAHGLAAQSGGALNLTSRKGEGTRVELWLPISAAEADPLDGASTAPVTPPGPPTAARALSVLVVDDDPLVLAGTPTMLEDMGHRAAEAQSARLALGRLTSGAAVDLVVTDYAMPGMTGLELADAVARLRPGLPVLLATGFAEMPADAANADLPRIAKRFTQAELARAVGQAAERALAQADGNKVVRLARRR